MASKKKDLKLNIMAEEILHFGMSVSKDGYKSARVVVKKGDKEYMSIGYEWEGEGIPEFVMSLMGFVQANKEIIDEANNKWEEGTDEEVEYAKKKCGGGKKGK